MLHIFIDAQYQARCKIAPFSVSVENLKAQLILVNKFYKVINTTNRSKLSGKNSGGQTMFIKQATEINKLIARSA